MPSKHENYKSPYTADRLIPGAFDGETVTRRRFMTASTHGAGIIALSAILLPALGFALSPVFNGPSHSWEDIGSTSDFTDSTYVPVTITIAPAIGDAGKSLAYVRKFNPTLDTDPYDKNEPYIAISSRCAHLGCPVRFVSAANRFICPCHGGVYDLLGRRQGGPPVRPLDRFPTRVVGDRVQLFSGRFSVNSQLRRFSPRDPGEPVDGIGQYLYPSRPTAEKPTPS